VSRQLVYQVARKTRENSEFVSKVFEKVGYTKPKTRMLSATESLYERYNKGNTARPKLRMMSAIEETKAAMDALGIDTKSDAVNHPPHYRAGGVETIDFIEAKDLNYRLGNVVKYVSRAGKKESDPLEDLKKARWYLDREIAVRERA
jgi:hypothetical protein